MARVLLVAPSVDATDVGEAWVAYQWAHRLGARHDVTLLTHRKRGRPSAVGQLPQVEVVEWDEPLLLSRPDRFNSLLKPWYPYFHLQCRRWIAAALAAGRRFDVGHQPTPVAMRYPSPLTRSGLPYVIGPVGGRGACRSGRIGCRSPALNVSSGVIGLTPTGHSAIRSVAPDGDANVSAGNAIVVGTGAALTIW